MFKSKKTFEVFGKGDGLDGKALGFAETDLAKSVEELSGALGLQLEQVSLHYEVLLGAKNKFVKGNGKGYTAAFVQAQNKIEVEPTYERVIVVGTYKPVQKEASTAKGSGGGSLNQKSRGRDITELF